ncbi:histidine kinase dimerization/phosphoacceptor domain -containing protein [Paenibacillus sp.]|uniref:histidine kinase dimerization/phosphoacceptor domain -containing protein n=1 Tax=Paenibacillus sp. TaxID=58172 RepID=UPI002D339A4D|nr:histidine kinase dimerization/phosphoacceptor domain -containing protein [Paenibacillus sp.]HZG84848.1 histidine kinase dimerization/phosphoacceptor domain -containing protein [Paenibacillus sp.]
MSANRLEIRDLTFHSPDGSIENIHVTLGSSEILALLAKNPEQSIFIQSLLGFQEGSTARGQLWYNQNLLNHGRFDYDKIAILHHKPLLIRNFSVAENLNFNRMPRRSFLPFIHWKKVRERAAEILTQLDFQMNLNTKVRNLSEEYQKLVYIAAIFSKQPELIIMHEPLDGLSAVSAAKLHTIMKQFKENGGSILYVTKQWEEAIKIADRISVLAGGKITYETSAAAAKNDPQILLREIGDYKHKGLNEHKDEDAQSVLNAVFKAAEYLTSEYELKDVLMLLAKEVTKVMNADGCSISLIDEETLSIIENFEYKKKAELQAKLKKSALMSIAKEQDIYYTNQHDREFDSLFETNENVKTLICIPVMIRSQITGIIQMYYENFYVYSKEELTYLSAFARHAAIAIEDTRLMGRSALLQESHHRIKNNLQSIVGLIALQKQFVKADPEKSISDILDSIIARIKSIATVHNLLSKNKLGRSIVNVKEIINEIVELIDVKPNITISLDLDNLFIPYNKATLFALIVNELVMNSHKHAFPGTAAGEIRIRCKQSDEHIFLSVSDNGRGLPNDFDPTKVKSLGLPTLQAIITHQLHGEMKIVSAQGHTVEVRVPAHGMFQER